MDQMTVHEASSPLNGTAWLEVIRLGRTGWRTSNSSIGLGDPVANGQAHPELSGMFAVAEAPLQGIIRQRSGSSRTLPNDVTWARR